MVLRIYCTNAERWFLGAFRNWCVLRDPDRAGPSAAPMKEVFAVFAGGDVVMTFYEGS